MRSKRNAYLQSTLVFINSNALAETVPIDYKAVELFNAKNVSKLWQMKRKMRSINSANCVTSLTSIKEPMKVRKKRKKPQLNKMKIMIKSSWKKNNCTTSSLRKIKWINQLRKKSSNISKLFNIWAKMRF